MLEKLQNLLGNTKVLVNEPMASHTTFRIGGPADYFVLPETVEELAGILKICKEENVPYFILGNGSNLLVGDKGFRGVVVQLYKNFDGMTIEGTTVTAKAGAMLVRVAKESGKAGLTGLEFASGIPGTIGGAMVMNAGAYGGEMKDVLVKCNHINEDGTEGSFVGDEMDLSYRHSAYSSGKKVITSVEIKLNKGDKDKIAEEMRDYLGRRKDKQPLEYPSAGSVFKRPEGYFAGALIEQSGLKGKRIGGAMVSEKHAGFIINYDNATTTDVLELIDFCRETVKEKFGVTLEAEIKTV